MHEAIFVNLTEAWAECYRYVKIHGYYGVYRVGGITEKVRIRK